MTVWNVYIEVATDGRCIGHVAKLPGCFVRAVRLAGYNRAELLAAVAGLPDAALDLKRDPVEMSVREILRHIGNVEEWYLSRLVEPDDLPQEWEHDDRLPIFEFLEMERRTVIEEFRGLSRRPQAHLPPHPLDPASRRTLDSSQIPPPPP